MHDFHYYFDDINTLIDKNINPNDICQLFIKCSRDMKKLLYQSFLRF